MAVEQWLARRRRWVLLVLVAASVGVRGVYFLQLSSGPGLELHRWNQSDMNYYDTWGRQIAHGDWLSARTSVPMHTWHHQVADRYLADHPDEGATLTAQAAQSGTDVDAVLWSRWMRGHQFYQDPLYPYLIGLTYRVVGDDVRFVFAWQMGLGVMSNVLIWLLARRFFGDDVVAACAAALAVLCAPLMYYELILLRETTIVFTGLATIWLADRVLAQGGWHRFALLGLSFGLAFLLKSSLLLLAVGVSLGIVAHFPGPWRRLWVPAAATAAGLAIALTPLVARNKSLNLPPLALASSGGLTFIISNDIGYDPASGFEIDAPRVAHLMGESGGDLVPAVIATLEPHTVASYAGLLWGKWDRAWYWFETPNNDNFYYLRLRAPVLAWLPVTFWLCAPLALVGLVLGARRFAPLWPLYVLVMCSLIPLLVFYTLGRFRIALTAAVIPFAALTLVELLRWTSQRQYRSMILATAAVLILVSWTGRPLRGESLIRPADWLMPFAVRYEPQVRAALNARDPARAASAYLEFFRYEPDAAQLSSAERNVFLTFGRMHTECAGYLRDSGQAGPAQAQLDRAGMLFRAVLATDPSNVQAHGRLGDALFSSQSFGEATVHYKAYLRFQPNDATVLARLGVSLMATGKPDEALLNFRHAVDVDPRNGEAQQDLANALLDQGHVDEAAGHAELAVALRANDPAAHDVLGRAWALQGRLDAAAAQFEEALRIDPAHADAREHLSRIRR